MMRKSSKMIETLARGYSSKGTRRELSNECQYDRVSMVFINIHVPVIRTKVASAFEGLMFEETEVPGEMKFSFSAFPQPF